MLLKEHFGADCNPEKTKQLESYDLFSWTLLGSWFSYSVEKTHDFRVFSKNEEMTRISECLRPYRTLNLNSTSLPLTRLNLLAIFFLKNEHPDFFHVEC